MFEEEGQLAHGTSLFLLLATDQCHYVDEVVKRLSRHVLEEGRRAENTAQSRKTVIYLRILCVFLLTLERQVTQLGGRWFREALPWDSGRKDHWGFLTNDAFDPHIRSLKDDIEQPLFPLFRRSLPF